MGYRPSCRSPGPATSPPRPPAGVPRRRRLDHLRAGELAGFGYGYPAAPGQWWHDQVRAGAAGRGGRAVAARPASSWSELHVRPRAQGHGAGRPPAARAARRAGRGRHHAAVHPGGRRATSRAWRLYRRFGFVDVLRHFHFPGDERPFAVLGRRPAAAPGRVSHRHARRGRAAGPVSRDGRRLAALLAVLVLAQICYPLTGGDGPGRARPWSPWCSATCSSVGARAAHPGPAGGGRAGRRGERRRARGRGARGGDRPPVRQLRLLRRARAAAGSACRWSSRWPGPDGLAGAGWSAVRLGRRGRLAPGRASAGGRRWPPWDLFLDPQMVDAGHWTWRDPTPALPGVPGIPVDQLRSAGCSSRCC